MILSNFPTTHIKPKYWIFLSKYLYICNTPQLFSTVSCPIGYQYIGLPNSHKCKPSTDKIPSQQFKREDIFHFVDGLEVTFLDAELRYQPRWWLRASGSVVWCFRCLVTVYAMSCHYRCCYIFTTTGVIFLIIAKSPTTHIKPKDWILLSKSLYIRNTPQLFSTVSSPIGDQYMSAPNSHKCKPSTDKIPSQQFRREEVFHLVAGL